ncbi:MAG: hypothetical protein A3B74_01835 [Candidatus Kerfeldbacteria bacterium RIFCSPHIGHO2_02_FULL_42_14]|uniref:HIT domain-containing protein n=1 Tax=Candidatus Kerfeldbacteria bacterium RIFCSPHIGHO2_02_FULL_42_14 TaxID=1798540 RepID=A0A1G2AS74_9BACT|nr:MAG: hypothetical protein A3B74_01835 [Candidatus Kerfeldbacteria bacterium RIFCSPHIGHO2_02_FULL_42_14]OGY82253.1 MAG: hypothetical protein A3E60_00165 [Candidatus Kerfeldbacteria bacterium RIFCSPHIGHO2_12_FULL_42_13]OGY82728.1 MAG: hypothetical protein A3I91_01055 [Candidatus Kerfeldbacteria bacterium RIFCSPLOWO2_02_FULL_42_19]
MIMTCLFCQKPNPIDFVHQTKYWNVFLAWDQTYLGRCIVALKRHCGDLAELKKEEYDEFIELVKRLESALRKSFDATMFNWTCLMNDAYQEKNPEPHVHWHFRPRYNHKVEIAGLVFEDLEFGHHYDRTKKREISEVAKKTIVSKIKENL